MSSGCQTCSQKKAPFCCETCGVSLCKSCAHFLDPEAFFYSRPLDSKEEKLATPQVTCQNCYDSLLLPQVTEYEANLEKAKEVQVYFKAQSKETRLMRREEKPIQILNCPDQDELVLRLAFQAAARGFNALLDVELKSVKKKDGSYSSTWWSGSAVPAHIHGRQVPKDRSLWQNPN